MSNIKLENLEINGYHLYQDKTNFNFGIDAVLLANFALRESILTSAKPVRVSFTSPLKICDFCTGTLPIPLIIYAKATNLSVGASTSSPQLHIDAFEIDKDQVALCERSILWNKENVSSAKNINNDITIYNDDIKNIFLNKEKYKNFYESYDILTVNPPYNKKGSGLTNLNDRVVAARHEISITFDDICHAANLILKSNKKFYFINQTNRFTEIVSTLKKHSFEIKKVSFIHPYVDKASNLFVAEAVKSGRPGVKVLEPIIIYEKNGDYTEKILKIYGK